MYLQVNEMRKIKRADNNPGATVMTDCHVIFSNVELWTRKLMNVIRRYLVM